MIRKHQICLNDLYWELTLKYVQEDAEIHQDHSLSSLCGGMPTDSMDREDMHQEQLMILCLITFDKKKSFYDTLQYIVVKLNKYYDHNKTHSYH